MKWLGAPGLAMALVAGSLAMTVSAEARVKREGIWPDADKAVTLDLDGVPRRDALRKLADAAGWSLIVHAPPGDAVDIHVKAQPASKVLEILLDDGDYTARRDGTLLSIERTSTEERRNESPAPPSPPSPPGSDVAPRAAPPAPPSPAAPAPPARDEKSQAETSSQTGEPHKHGPDRTVMGGDVKIAKGETVGDLTVLGGSVDVEGEATGNVTVFGGAVHLHEGARVHGHATVFGGTIALDNGSHVDGDVSCVGGHVERAAGSVVGGDVSVKGGHESSDDGDEEDDPPEQHLTALQRVAESVLDSVRWGAFLFVIGTVLLALAGRRMDQLRGEVATRPMRSIALGVVGILAAVVVFLALCVTVIGIPVALIAAVLAAFGVLGAMCAVLSVVGETLLRHKTENPYVRLALGCAIFVAVSAIPKVGSLVFAAVVLAGVGILFATRGAGFFSRKNGNGTSSSYPSSGTV